MLDRDTYYKESRRIRGEIIERAIILERFVDWFIVSHFCTEYIKKIELLETVIATKRIIFENKVQVFKILLDKHYKNFDNENPSFANKLIKLIEERNVFAHYTLFSGEEQVSKFHENGTITFVKFNNSTEYIEYSKEKIEKIMDGLVDMATNMRKLTNL